MKYYCVWWLGHDKYPEDKLMGICEDEQNAIAIRENIRAMPTTKNPGEVYITEEVVNDMGETM